MTRKLAAIVAADVVGLQPANGRRRGTPDHVLRLYLRNTGLSFEAFAGPLFELEEGGWITVKGEIYTTTPEGAREFASGTTVVVDTKPKDAGESKPAAKARKRRKAARSRPRGCAEASP
jgi:hypothetical protein